MNCMCQLIKILYTSRISFFNMLKKHFLICTASPPMNLMLHLDSCEQIPDKAKDKISDKFEIKPLTLNQCQWSVKALREFGKMFLLNLI